MVYSGRPSTGCARCKSRRKKCDETRPGCLNCRKIKRECPGFPEKIDLIFRHETASVKRRVTETKTSSANGMASKKTGNEGTKDMASKENAHAGDQERWKLDAGVKKNLVRTDSGLSATSRAESEEKMCYEEAHFGNLHSRSPPDTSQLVRRERVLSWTEVCLSGGDRAI